jgi:sulfur carrier protein ThiS
MANNVTVVQLGGKPTIMNGLTTVGDLLSSMELEASVKVNGQTVDEEHELSDYDFVSLGEKVKGGYTASL